jgi:radical SAM superfamily enzyme YgiQ (UPF0313 family)
MNWSLFRMIIPAFPEINIFTRQAKKTTALGPIMVATVANKLWGWRVEVIDENNYRGPRDSREMPDHAILQKQNPAQVVGFYCGLTSTMERVWETARFYRQERVTTIAGGWHAHYCSEETLKHDIDLVVHGDGESSIRKILTSLKREEPLNNILGTSFLEDGQLQTNQPEFLEEPDLNDLPYPDFSLLKYARIKIYPIGRIRGCSMNCEFCGVKGAPRWASAQHLFDTVSWLVETKKARHFFIVDDRSEQDLDRTVEFFSMIARKYGNRLHFTVQARLESARNTKLLEIMRDAGVRIVCIGYESPIDDDLRAMRKGLLSSQMLEWTKIWHCYIRWIHAMFIVGYPLREKQNSIGAKEIIRRFKNFINKASLDTVQILLPGPGPGTDLRLRLEKEGRVFPLDLVPWSKYDGNYVCFKPDNMSVRELQDIPAKLMSRFYNPLSFVRIPLRTIAFPVDFLIRGWERWYRGWYRDVVRYGGHLLLRRWRKKQRDNKFIGKLENR